MYKQNTIWSYPVLILYLLLSYTMQQMNLEINEILNDILF